MNNQETAQSKRPQQGAALDDWLDLSERPPFVRVLTPLLGHGRAEIVNAVLAGLWPFTRILMIISIVWIVAGLITYRFETHRTMTLDEIAAAGDEMLSGMTARRDYRDEKGEIIVRKDDPITLEIVEKLREAGHDPIDVYTHHMYKDVNDAIWWGIVTMTTVGYGDRYPETNAGRIVAVFLMFGSLMLISSFTATVASVFVARRIQEAQQQQEIEWEGHTIFLGWNEMAPAILQELNAAVTPTRQQVVLMNERSEDSMALQLRGYDNLELRFFRGNFVREEDLLKTRLAHAANVIIIPDSSGGIDAGDNKTIEATVTIKDMAPEVKVFAHVLDPERLPTVRRAQVDDVVVTNEFIPSMLAGFVVRRGMTQTIRELLTLDSEMEIAIEEIPERFHERPVSELWEALRREEAKILIALVMEEEGLGLETSMQGGDQYVIDFIKEQIAEAGITIHETGSRTRVTVNPPANQIIHETDAALVIRKRQSVVS